jgi:hypothetical protein
MPWILPATVWAVIAVAWFLIARALARSCEPEISRTPVPPERSTSGARRPRDPITPGPAGHR